MLSLVIELQFCEGKGKISGLVTVMEFEYMFPVTLILLLISTVGVLNCVAVTLPVDEVKVILLPTLILLLISTLVVPLLGVLNTLAV